jgi:hypothetical protein
MKFQGLQLVSDDAFRNYLAQVLHQESHTVVLRERDGM